LTTLVLTLSPFASAAASTDGRVIESESLSTCQANSGLTASLFNVAFTPGNQTLQFKITGVSTINGKVLAEIDITAYGYEALKRTNINPCDSDINLSGLCPMTSGQIDIDSVVNLPADTVSAIPSIAYSIPDLDGQVQIKIYDLDETTGGAGAQVACVQADLSNGKTVYQKGVGWSSAVIAGLALLTSAVVAGLGHSNTATHVAANAMSLFGFFQSQAIFGMTAVHLPPIVQSWTQNFQWSMGIIRVDFIQEIASWYQQATGGTPSTILTDIGQTSVDVQKRSLDTASSLVRRALPALARRQSTGDQSTNQGGSVTVRGIDRVGFRAAIEPTNVFMTAYIFFVIFVLIVCLLVVAFRFILDAFSKTGKMKSDKFQDFRNGWTTVLRGILFRIILIGLPQMTILCFWELLHQDSAGEEALAVITILTMIVMLAWACGKVWRLAKRSIAMHKNPAYILYSDPVCLHKWGFLYVQFKATAYWFIMPWLVFTLAIGLFVAFGQSSGTAQAIGLLILNAAFLIGLSILRPYMDKKTNAFNISIAAVNFISSIFLLFFTNIFGLPVSSDRNHTYARAITDIVAGSCRRRHGCHLFRPERSLRAYSTHHGSCCHDVCYLFQEP